MSEIKYRDDITSCHLFVITNSLNRHQSLKMIDGALISSYTEKYFILVLCCVKSLQYHVGLLYC